MPYYGNYAGDYRTYGYGGDPGFLKSIGKLLKKVAPIALGAITGGGSIAAAGMAGKVGLPMIKKALPAVIGKATQVGRKMAPIAIPTAVGVGTGMLIDQFGRPVRKKSRRMNPCNDRALRRALRRIESYDRLRKRVDKSLRKACPPRRAAPRARPVCK